MRNEIVVQVSPDFTGRICLCVGNGRLKASGPVREGEHICTMEIAEAAGYQVKEVQHGNS